MQWPIQKFWKTETEDNVSTTTSLFIANAHNELYAFYARKGDWLKKIAEANGGGGAPFFESATKLACSWTFVSL